MTSLLRSPLRQRQRRHSVDRHWMNVAIVRVGEYVGLEEIDDGIWNVYFGPPKLGRLHERSLRIEDEYGRLCRHNV